MQSLKVTDHQIRVENSKRECREEKIRNIDFFFFPKAQYHFRKLNMPRAYFSRTLKYLNKLLEGGLQGMILQCGAGYDRAGGAESQPVGMVSTFLNGWENTERRSLFGTSENYRQLKFQCPNIKFYWYLATLVHGYPAYMLQR